MAIAKATSWLLLIVATIVKYTMIVLVDSVLPGGGFFVARRRELRDRQLAG